MAKPYVLSASDRSFFQTVNAAVLANPFSERRSVIDREISGLLKVKPSEAIITAAIRNVAARIERLESSGRTDLRDYTGDDRRILKSALLYDVFHRYIPEFDELIEAQQQTPAKSLPVPFAAATLTDLEAKGFAQREAERYFALSYQLRRAFFFIRLGLVGRSASMQSFRESLWNNVFTSDIDLYDNYLWNRMEDFSTILIGETGTGKGSAAMAIGQSAFIPFNRGEGRFQESFASTLVSLNLSQFSETIIESELFGHTKGAFTGALQDHQGIFSRCSPNGAIFLDEIGEIPHSLQIKLLKVIEERAFRPVGGHADQRFEGRVIAATNRSAETLLNRGIMREDFYYRLCSDVIVVPPLRRRIAQDPGELDDITGAVVAKIIGKPSPDLVKMVIEVIDRRLGRHYPWPGNVRELAQCVRRVLLNRSYSRPAIGGGTDLHPEFVEAMAEGRVTVQELQAGYCHHLYTLFGTYGEVARRTGLDRRTVKKYIEAWHQRRGDMPSATVD